jgi:hypothetical protein
MLEKITTRLKISFLKSNNQISLAESAMDLHHRINAPNVPHLIVH